MQISRLSSLRYADNANFHKSDQHRPIFHAFSSAVIHTLLWFLWQSVRCRWKRSTVSSRVNRRIATVSTSNQTTVNRMTLWLTSILCALRQTIDMSELRRGRKEREREKTIRDNRISSHSSSFVGACIYGASFFFFPTYTFPLHRTSYCCPPIWSTSVRDMMEMPSAMKNLASGRIYPRIRSPWLHFSRFYAFQKWDTRARFRIEGTVLRRMIIRRRVKKMRVCS